MGAVGRAFELAFALHEGQTDKAGEIYLAHLVRVAARLEDEAGRVVALLHDAVEDQGASLGDIRAAFGEEVAAAVDAITRREGERPEAYYARVAANPLARRVKLADLADNSDPRRLASLDEATAARLIEKYERARHALGA